MSSRALQITPFNLTSTIGWQTFSPWVAVRATPPLFAVWRPVADGRLQIDEWCLCLECTQYAQLRHCEALCWVGGVLFAFCTPRVSIGWMAFHSSKTCMKSLNPQSCHPGFPLTRSAFNLGNLSRTPRTINKHPESYLECLGIEHCSSKSGKIYEFH